MDNNLVDYSLIADNGDRYVTTITKRDMDMYEMDSHKRYRLLNHLEKNSVPVERYQVSGLERGSDLVAASSSSTSTSNSCSSTQPTQLAPSGRAQGKTGASWKERQSVSALLQCSLPYRKWLRVKIVPETAWRSISDDMFKMSLDYSWEQIKEKTRNMKRTFKEAKDGKHGGQKWDHYWLMTFIYDDPISTGGFGETTLCPQGFNLLQQQTSSPYPNVIPQTSMVENQQVVGQTTDLLQSLDNVDIEKSISSLFSAETDYQVDGNFNNFVDSNDATSLANESHKETYEEENLNISLLNLDTNNILIGSPGFSSTVVEAIVPDLVNVTKNLDSAAVQPPILPDKSLSKQQTIIKSVTAACLLNSPSRKKSKGPAPLLGLQSPAKTPKRKQSKASLQWEADDTKNFVELLVTHKDALVQSQIPIATWKDISNELAEFTINKDWQNCRDKFHQMNSFFVGTVLPTGGLLGIKKWPYYSQFCSIFDIPEHYHLLVVEDGEAEMFADKPSLARLWSKENILLLISLYKAKLTMFKATKSCLRHNVIWAQISQEMKLFLVNISWKQCRDQFKVLKTTFHNEHMACGKTGASPSKWEHYKAMEEFFEGGPSLNAAHSVTVGMGITCRTRGELEAESSRTTRTKRNSNPQQKAAAKPKKPVYRTLAAEMSEKQFEQREKLYNEVHLLRKNNEKSMEERSKVFKKINARLDQLNIVLGNNSKETDDDDVKELDPED